MAVSKPDRNRLWRRGSVRDSSFEAQQKQFVFPKRFGSCNGKASLLKLLKL